MVETDSYPDFQAAYRDNVERVYRLMYRKVGNRADAEDLTAEVFTAAMRPLDMSVSAPEVRAYLFTTARTVLAAHWRRTLGQQVTLLDSADEHWLVAPPMTDPEPPSNAEARAAAILAELPEPHRKILQLRFLDACPIKEAAEALGISIGYAKVLQHRALRRAAKLGET